jgi:hypothetical protein
VCARARTRLHGDMEDLVEVLMQEHRLSQLAAEESQYNN